MNEDLLRNAFQIGLADLIQEVTQIVAGDGRDPYAGPGPHAPHEHDTRTLFVDRFLELLGWRLGASGNVLEEARIKAETTRFMDYVGVVEDTQAPLMIFEAKAWDKPYITAREPGRRETDIDLMVGGIRHLLDDNTHETSPVTKLWHDYLVQVCGYVRTMKDKYGHNTPRVVLANGPWFVVFTEPVTTFCIGRVSANDIVIFRLDDYVLRAEELFSLLHRSVLARDIPFPVRPAQLRQYVEHGIVAAVFHGLHVHYEQTGSPFYQPRPQILVYPTLIIQRDDGVLITVVSHQEGIPLSYAKIRSANEDEDDQLTLEMHLMEVQAKGAELHAACEAELGGALEIATLDTFPGFSLGPARAADLGPRMVMQLKPHQNQWLMATGTAAHYLLAAPRVDPCQFHAWAACHAVGQNIGISALSVRSVDPRAVFIDTQPHHCANQVVQDRRMRRCHIMAIDQRTCCQACVYMEGCWQLTDLPNLPCGQ
ncbi:hypothetical protein SAMN05428966_117103 [Massilia sp. PDC64]|nr:hypothetical protein [Massilia sp. PDC64]SDF59337.1 hypothetical protein SAMN05428966_117103 [Massilia sp. PDC64]